jgi:hypothetical protein
MNPEMSESYYLRIRGEVKGPVARSELVSQIRKKRIGRHHEVSPDAITWMRAGDIPDLFEAVVAARETPPESRSQAPDQRARPERDKPQDDSSLDDTEWFYAKGRNRLGPVSESELRTMLATGRVTGTELLWNENLEDWIPASQLPQFSSLTANTGAVSPQSTQQGIVVGEGKVLTLSLFSLQFACMSLLCAPLVAMLTAIIMDSPGFSRSNIGAGMLGMLVVVGVFGALPIFSAIVGILTGHHSLRIHAKSPGQYQGSGYALTSLIVCYGCLAVTLVTLFVFLIVIGVKSA